ncbi:hypothetical protein [Lysobacter hankyongensis]|uniref:hypothetical protein n=1 Tax=Lysobacter hankyongensis TaxID=1176535 RepID=UPI0031E98A64
MAGRHRPGTPRAAFVYGVESICFYRSMIEMARSRLKSTDLNLLAGTWICRTSVEGGRIDLYHRLVRDSVSNQCAIRATSVEGGRIDLYHRLVRDSVSNQCAIRAWTNE